VLGARGLDGFYKRWCDFFGTSLGAYYNPTTKQYEYGPLMKRYRTMVAFVNRIYSEGILHPEYSTMSDPDWQSKVDNREWGATLDHRGQHPGLAPLNAPEEEEGVYYFAQSLDVDGERILWPAADWWQIEGPLAVSATATPEQIEASIRLIDYLYSTEGLLTVWYGKKDVDWVENEDGTKCFTGTFRVGGGGWVPEAWCSGVEPAEGEAPGYAELDLLDFGGSLVRIGYPEHGLMPEWLFIYGDWSKHAKYLAETLADSVTDPLVPLTFNTEELETQGELLPPLQTYILEETQKFIEGLRPLNDDEWATFTARIEELGGKQVADISNAALARIP
jgi:putative aldouronate transport system substrate-binding protein